MRRSTYYLFLLPVALALMALVPMYPAQATDYATFGNPQTTYRAAFLPATEIVAGGFDWTVEVSGCALDAAQRTRLQASPGVIALYIGSTFNLWLFLVLLLSRTSSEALRKAILIVLGAVLMVTAGGWLQFYTLIFLMCPPDLAIPSAIAGGFAVLAVALGEVLLTRHEGLAHAIGPRSIRHVVRVAKS